MIKLMQFIEKELRLKMPELGFTFILVGSIAEGTRIHWANELDITMQFNGIQNCPLLIEDNPFRLKLLNESKHPLENWCENGVFKYELFFSFLLHLLDEVISNGKDTIKRFTNGRIQLKEDETKCGFTLRKFWKNQRQENGESHIGLRRQDNVFYTHTEESIFNVTQTKCGACLVFEWKYKDQFDILTIDLIPVIPVKGKDLNEMNSLITSTLFHEKPPNWLKHLKGFINRDRVLPESFKDQFKEDSAHPIQVGMKLLHYEKENNFIIRPAQQLAVTSELEKNARLKHVYCEIKSLKSLLDVDISSYFVKKVLLTEEMKLKIKGSGVQAYLYTALQHPDLKDKFDQIIDYGMWRENDWEIPILYSKVED